MRNKQGDRSFNEITSDEKYMVTGFVVRNLCVGVISRLMNKSEADISKLLAKQTGERINSMSPAEVEKTLIACRDIDG